MLELMTVQMKIPLLTESMESLHLCVGYEDLILAFTALAAKRRWLVHTATAHLS